MASGNVVGDRYHLLERLDAGGMGEVWKAGDTRLGGKLVAVKRIPVDDGRAVTANDIELFRREALAASQLRHRNAVAVTDFFVDHGAPFIVMEYVEGRTLGSVVGAGRPLSGAEVARLGTDVAAALAAAHAVGLTHRDVKPDNVIVRPDGSPVLVDFGIARGDEDARLTTTGFFRGTLRYVAPELLEGADPRPASDMWSLGVTLFELYTGISPFDRPSQSAIMTAILVQPIPTVNDRGPLGKLIADLLNRAPERRPSAAEISARLSQLAGPVHPIGEEAVDTTQSSSRITRLEWIVFGAALLGFVFSMFDFYGYLPPATTGSPSNCAAGLYPAGSGLAGQLAIGELCSSGGAATSAWHGLFGWLGVLLLIVGAAVLAIAALRDRPRTLLTIAAAATVLAVLSELVGGLTVPQFAALRDTTTAQAYDVAVAGSGVRWSYWVVLVLVAVAAGAAVWPLVRNPRG